MQVSLEALATIVGRGNVISGADVAQRRVDWMTGAPCRAGAIVRPADTQELASIMRLCHAHAQPVVTHGGLTGLVHGGEVGPDELAISLERMTAIEAIDPVGATMTVQAGIPCNVCRKRPRPRGLCFRWISARAAPAPSAAISLPTRAVSE